MQLQVGRSERITGGRLADLFQTHASDAVRLAYLLTGDRDLAQDLVQDAFVRLCGRFIDLRHPDGFSHYLRRTIVNLATSHFRRRKTERAYVEREGRHPRSEEVEHDPETREALWHSLRVLSKRQRAAIVLRFYEDLSEAETAEILGCRPGTVKSLVSRGIETLRAEVRGGTDGG